MPDETPLTAEQALQAAEQALASGQVEKASELFNQALATEDRFDWRKDAVVRLVAAGRADLCRRLLDGRIDGPSVALAAAVAMYQATPPPDPQDPAMQANAYCIPAMADALFVLAENPSPSTGEGGPQGCVRVASVPAWQAVEPVRLSLPLLEQMCSTWQSWQHLRLMEAEAEPPPLGGNGLPAGPGEGEPPPRAMILWVLEGSPNHDGHYLSHPVGLAEQTPVAAHLGSWPLRMENPSGEVLAAAEGFSGPGAIHLAVWQGSQMVSRLRLGGQVDPEGFVVTSASGVRTFEALLAVITDGRLQAGRVVPNDVGEREAILGLAERLGHAGRLRLDGLAVELAPPGEQDDYIPATQWLTAVAGYVRYGRLCDAAGQAH